MCRRASVAKAPVFSVQREVWEGIGDGEKNLGGQLIDSNRQCFVFSIFVLCGLISVFADGNHSPLRMLDPSSDFLLFCWQPAGSISFFFSQIDTCTDFDLLQWALGLGTVSKNSHQASLSSNTAIFGMGSMVYN